MELTIEKVGKILTDASERGFNLKVKDISYILLNRYFEDKSYAYRVCFGNDANYSDNAIEEYENSEGYRFLKGILNEVREGGFGSRYAEDITFEENKAYMLKLKKDTEEAMNNGEVEMKDGLKILADISTRLNDKFNVSSQERDQIIFVNQKYDDLCPRCSIEIARRPISKEEAMELYDLVEKR